MLKRKAQLIECLWMYGLEDPRYGIAARNERGAGAEIPERGKAAEELLAEVEGRSSRWDTSEFQQ